MASILSQSLSTPAQDAAAAAMLATQSVQDREHFRVACNVVQVPYNLLTVIIMMTLPRNNYTPELKAFIGPTIQAHQDVINEALELASNIGDEMRQRQLSRSMVAGSTVAAPESSQIDSDKESSCGGGGGNGDGGGGGNGDGNGDGSNNTCL